MMQSIMDLRNELGAIKTREVPYGGDNLAIALATYFCSHPDKPEDEDDEDDETGWGKWAVEKTNDLLDRIVEHMTTAQSERKKTMMTHDEAIKTIREALTYYHIRSLSVDEHITAAALAALDSLTAESKQEPSEDARELTIKIRETVENIGLIVYPESRLFLDDAAVLIESAFDRVRRECADKGARKFRDMVKSPNQRDIPAFKRFRDNQADELRAAILGKEPDHEAK